MSTEGTRHRVWDVMEGQMENFPDRGVERPMKSLPDRGVRAILNGTTSDNAVCFVCGKTWANHDTK
eukprot:14647786-Heterocapsa_arctica.AAC.1